VPANLKRPPAETLSVGEAEIRFWNDEVSANMEGVLQRIAEALKHPHPGPLPGRERGSEPSG